MHDWLKRWEIGLLTILAIDLMAFPILAMDDAIIAVVNEELITLNDLTDYMRTTYIELVADGMKEEEIKIIMDDLKANGIERLIEEKLILSKAKKVGLKVNEKLVAERIQEIKSRYTSEQEFMRALVEHGATLTDLRNKVLNQFEIQFIIDHEIKSKIHIHPQEVTDFYQQNMDRFQQKERIELESIFVAFTETKKASRERIEEALELIKNKEGFQEVAKRYSDIPSVGIVGKGQLLEEIEEVVFNLKEGEVSSIVEVDNGLYIFKLKQKFPPTTAPLSEVKDYITKFLYNKKFTDQFHDWIEELKKNAYIDIKK